MFGTLQTLPGWLNVFGQNIGGKQALTAATSSVMNSTPWAAKFIGTATSEIIVEHLGYRYAIYVVCLIQVIGTIVELTAPNWPAFTVGRCLVYTASGLVETVVPSYSADVSPAPLRSMFAGSVVFVVVIGQLWSNLMGRAYATDTSSTGWRIVTAMQLIPVVLILIAIPFTPGKLRVGAAGLESSSQNRLDGWSRATNPSKP